MTAKDIGAFVLQIFKFHKKKLVFVIFSSLFFFVVLFPFADLSDFVTSAVAKASRNQVFLQFEDLGLSLLPSPSIRMNEVSLITPTLPELKSSSVFISPSLFSLITGQIGFSTRARDLFNGDVYLSVSPGEKIENETQKNVGQWQDIEVDLEKVNLKKVIALASTPVKLKGTLNGNLEMSIDPEFQQQPKAEIDLEVLKAAMPTSIPLQNFGSLVLPPIVFSAIKTKMRLLGGQLIVEQGLLGQSNEPLSGRIKGKMSIRMRKIAGVVRPLPGSYDFKIELLVKNSLSKKLSLFLGFIDSYRSPTNGGARYLFRIKGRNFINPPNISAINKF